MGISALEADQTLCETGGTMNRREGSVTRKSRPKVSNRVISLRSRAGSSLVMNLSLIFDWILQEKWTWRR